MEVTEEEFLENHVGITSGVIPLSPYRTEQPTMICGPGRGGTSALAGSFVKSGVCNFVATDLSDGGNYELKGINTMLTDKVSGAVEFKKFREETQSGYAKDFVFKTPSYEIIQRANPELTEAWSGANLIVMVRDPVCLAMREYSVEIERKRNQDRHIEAATRRVISSVKAAYELSDKMGVALVSYEKLMLATSEAFDSINTWMGREFLVKRNCTKFLVANNPCYLRRQTLGLARIRKKRGNGNG